MIEQADLMRQEHEFQQAQDRKRWARIIAVAKANPDLSMDLLCERFGENVSQMQRRLSLAGIKRAPRSLILTREERARLPPDNPDGFNPWQRKR